MNNDVHVHITRRGLSFLPATATEFWDQHPVTLDRASNYLDYYAAPDYISAEAEREEPEWRDFLFVPTAHGLELMTLFASPQKIRENFPEALRYYLENMLALLAEEDYLKATKFAGCLSHLIGDTAQPAHVVDDAVIMTLLPPPPGKAVMFHAAVEKISGKADQPHTPVLLGSNVDELVWRLVERMEQLTTVGQAGAVPILQAIYADDIEAAERAASPSVQASAELFADCMWTVYCLHHNAFDPADLAALSCLDLTELQPREQYCDMLFNYGIFKNEHPFYGGSHTVKLEDSTGNSYPGIAMMANMAPTFRGVREAFAEYTLLPGAYHSFEALAGLNANCDNQTEVIFEIYLDDELAYTSPATGTDPVPIKLELNQARTLRLRARDAREAPCKTAFFYPFFGNPRLTRN